MAFLTAAVVLVGVLCVIDLLLSFGIIRRLREQNETLRQVQQQATAGADPDIALPAGSPVGPFTTTATTGTALSTADIAGRPVLAGFFSPSCEPCKERMPEFVDYAKRFDGKVVAVAYSGAGDTADIVAVLSEVADVVVEDDKGPVHEAFGASGYPALCMADANGIVLASGWQMSSLPVPATL